MPSLLARALPPPHSLPTVHATKVQEDVITGIGDRQAESYGFNSGIPWSRPGSYVRWIPPMDSDRDKQVEYDMDEQDRDWLDAINAQRRKEALDTVTYEFFEIVVDRLEKEWFALTKRFPKSSAPVPSDDGKCAICDDGECENSNAIVFCDGCNLAVHQDCYGVPYIPEGQWLCRKCTVSPDKPVSCVLCPTEFGAFKQTTTGTWAHLLCAIWIPETGVSNTVYMEPIDGLDIIPKGRWKLVCYLCKRRMGACIQCSNRSCFTAFHVTCARDYGLYLQLSPQSAHYDGPSENKAYCHRHTPKDDFDDPTSSVRHKRIQHSPPEYPPFPKKKRVASSTSKSSRAYKKSYTTGPPIIPKYIYDHVFAYVDRMKIRKKHAVVEMICRYWSLKREMRRGAPLLKRLHLEPWTASSLAGPQSDADKARKLQLIIRLRQDLENARMLAELVRKREKAKLSQAQLLNNLIDTFVFPMHSIMSEILQKAISLDRLNMFLHPVPHDDVPDYSTIIKNPMDWTTIKGKIHRREYLTFEAFQSDIELVLHNAKIYNRSDTPFHRAAVRIEEALSPIFADFAINEDDGNSKWQQHIVDLVSLLTKDTIDRVSAYEYDNTTTLTSSRTKFRAPRGRPRKTRSSIAEGLVEEDEDALASGSTALPKEPQPLTPKQQLARERLTIKRKEYAQRHKEKKERIKQSRVREREKAHARKEAAQKEASESMQLLNTKEDKEADRVPGTSKKAAGNESLDRSLYTENVDDRSSFVNFASGWILPERTRKRSSVPEGSSGEWSYPSDRIVFEMTELAPPETPPRKSQARNAREPPGVGRHPGKAEEISSELSELSSVSRKSESSPSSRRYPSRPSLVKNVESNAKGALASSARSTYGHMSQKTWDQEMLSLKNSPEVLIAEKTDLPDGTLVWAKMKGYPEYPAEVTDEGDEIVPNSVLASKPKDSQGYTLVLFFGKTRTWQWIARDRLWMMSVNKDLDERMLSSRHLGTQKAPVRAAYDQAMAVMEIE